MIHADDYQQIRKAQKKDIRRIISLIRQSVQNEELVRRTRADILSQLDDYWVLEVDRNIVEIGHAAHVDPGLRHSHHHVGVTKAEAVDHDDAPVEIVASGGKIPRNFAFSPNGKWLVCAAKTLRPC